MPSSPLRRWLGWGLRLLLAALFVVSSVAKLMAIDDFELYIYSYGFFSLNFTYLVARLCIVAEFLLGVLLALGWWPRLARLLTLGLLLAFSLFLCYAALVGRTDSCQCMGRLVDLDPVQSLLKNAVLILLVLLYFRVAPPAPRRGRWWVAALVGVAATATVFCLSVPDNWMFGPSRTRYNEPLLQEALAPEGALAGLQADHGHHVVAFVTPGCPYCRMARQKMGSIASRHGLDTLRIHFVEPSDLPEGLFLDITLGQRPLILLMEEGQPVATYHYRNINERQIARSLR